MQMCMEVIGTGRGSPSAIPGWDARTTIYLAICLRPFHVYIVSKHLDELHN
jgi:hypothetical protein